jgi:hypothetical protein
MVSIANHFSAQQERTKWVGKHQLTPPHSIPKNVPKKKKRYKGKAKSTHYLNIYRKT